MMSPRYLGCTIRIEYFVISNIHETFKILNVCRQYRNDRNGSFLIENGKITKPIGRLRFTQSFITSLSQGNVISVGDKSRYADSEFGEGMLKVPKLHLKEFNFTGGVSG